MTMYFRKETLTCFHTSCTQPVSIEAGCILSMTYDFQLIQIIIKNIFCDSELFY